MLTNLALSNFKAWRHIERMRLAPLTGLFGTNSSGKSSILQLLLLLKQTAESPDRQQVLNLGDSKSHVALGTYRDIVSAHTSTELSLTLDWEVAKPVSVMDPEAPDQTLFESAQLHFHSSIAANGTGKLTVKHMEYGLGEHRFGMVRQGESPIKYELTAKAGGFSFRRNQGRPWPLPPPAKFYGFPDEARAYHQNAGFLSDLEFAFERLLKNTYYLGPLREFPQREYPWAGGDPADMGRRGEFAIAAILASRERGTTISRGKGKKKLTVEQYVAHWLKELGLIHEFRVAEITKGSNLYRVHVCRMAGGTDVLITDVGFGVSQVLPVLVLCYYAPEGSTILLEQPEIHLHPSVQSRLADVFIDACTVRNVQFIIESHSEHLMRRFQRRIAENDLRIDQCAFYFCDAKADGSSLTPLDVDLYGTIKNWPRDFFGNEMEDIAAAAEAAQRRRSAR